MDFTLKKYRKLLENIQSSGFETYGILDWFEQKPDSGVLIRHDVDRRANNSLKVAKLEKELGIKSTYYFRITSGSFKPVIIKAIKDLGHEIGYHYEDLSIAKGHYDEGIKLFQKHLKQFEGLANVKTIAMHGSPLSKYDNRDIWEKYDFKKYGVEAEAFLSIDYKDVYYFTDTGRSWSSEANLRDKVDSDLDKKIDTTDELIKFIKENKGQKFAVVSHPERWDDNLLEWSISYAKDRSINIIKLILKNLRK